MKKAENLANAEDGAEIHASVLLRRIIAEAPAESFTIAWLVDELPTHSFGSIILFLAVIALLPVISIPARLLIIVLTGQIILGYGSPVLPERLMKRKLPSRYLARLERHVLPCLLRLEYIVRPRWPVVLKMRRVTAFVAMTGMAFSLAAPIPFINMPVAAIGILMALSFIEHDGLMLFLALCLALAVLAPLSMILLKPFF